MTIERFSIDGFEYDAAQLPPELRPLIDRMAFTQHRLQELADQQALLLRAKNAYISDLKAEIVKARSGVDFGALFHDD